MNAHTPFRLVTPSTDAGEAAVALGKIRDIADGLVLIGNSICQEGDRLHGNVVATIAGLIHELAADGERALGVE